MWQRKRMEYSKRTRGKQFFCGLNQRTLHWVLISHTTSQLFFAWESWEISTACSGQIPSADSSSACGEWRGGLQGSQNWQDEEKGVEADGHQGQLSFLIMIVRLRLCIILYIYRKSAETMLDKKILNCHFELYVLLSFFKVNVWFEFLNEICRS